MKRTLRLSRRIRSLLSSRDGVALLMVLFVVVALTSLVISLSDTTQRHIQLTQCDRNGLQAFMTAQAGLQAAAALLNMSTQVSAFDMSGGRYDAYSSLWNCESEAYKENAAIFMSIPLCGNSLLEPILTPAVGPRESDIQQQQPRTPCFVMDENRKLSISGLVKDTNTTQETTAPEVFDRLAWLLQYLVKQSDLILPEEMKDSSNTFLTDDTTAQTPIEIGQARQLAGYVVDWLDSINNKASGEYNPDLAEESCPFDGKPYTTKNGAMDSTDELALVCGFRHMPRSIIDEIGRNLTVYGMKTNINTATPAVLYAFCAVANNNSPDEAVSAAIHKALHPQGDVLPTAVVSKASPQGFKEVLLSAAPEGVLDNLAAAMGTQSDIFRMGIAGVVLDTETGAVEANSRVTMVISRAGISQSAPPSSSGGARSPIYYYRED